MASSLRIIGTYLRGAAGGWEPLVACSLTLIGNYFRGAAGGWEQLVACSHTLIGNCNARLLTGYITMVPFNNIPSAILQLS